MSGIVRLSNSELQTFKDCRRRWWLSYYRRLKPRSQDMTGALAFGTRIHAALDAHYAHGVPLLKAHADLVETDKSLLLQDFRDRALFEFELLCEEANPRTSFPAPPNILLTPKLSIKISLPSPP